MTDAIETQNESSSPSLEQGWGASLVSVVCERCDWGFLIPETMGLDRCPHCFQPTLGRIDLDVNQMPYTQPPELTIPFALSEAQLGKEIQRFTSGIPYPPLDLAAKNLQARLQRVFLPMWLVDASVRAAWKAEVGFDYQVVSHQDQYSGSGWTSQQVKEGRVRWEPRLGKLERSYSNIAAPALEEHAALQADLGFFNLTSVRSYKSQDIGNAFIRLPDRSPEDAWSDAQMGLFNAAAEECRKAARADHLRQFSWQPEFEQRHWTQLLLPVFTAFYLDDDRQPQRLLIHGQSGKINGVRRASMQRAKRSALIVLGIAVLIFVLGLILAGASLAFPPLLVPGFLGLAAALLVGLGAIIPPVRAGWFNRSQKT